MERLFLSWHFRELPTAQLLYGDEKPKQPSLNQECSILNRRQSGMGRNGECTHRVHNTTQDLTLQHNRTMLPKCLHSWGRLYKIIFTLNKSKLKVICSKAGALENKARPAESACIVTSNWGTSWQGWSSVIKL